MGIVLDAAQQQEEAPIDLKVKAERQQKREKQERPSQLPTLPKQ